MWANLRPASEYPIRIPIELTPFAVRSPTSSTKCCPLIPYNMLIIKIGVLFYFVLFDLRRKPAHWTSQVLKLASLQMSISWNEGNSCILEWKFNLHCSSNFIVWFIRSMVFFFCFVIYFAGSKHFAPYIFISIHFDWTIYELYIFKSHWIAHTQDTIYNQQLSCESGNLKYELLSYGGTINALTFVVFSQFNRR